MGPTCSRRAPDAARLQRAAAPWRAAHASAAGSGQSKPGRAMTWPCPYLTPSRARTVRGTPVSADAAHGPLKPTPPRPVVCVRCDQRQVTSALCRPLLRLIAGLTPSDYLTYARHTAIGGLGAGSEPRLRRRGRSWWPADRSTVTPASGALRASAARRPGRSHVVHTDSALAPVETLALGQSESRATPPPRDSRA